MVSNYEDSLKLTKISLQINGIRIYPSNINIKCFNCLYYFNVICLLQDVAAEISWLIEGIQTGKSFEELSLIIPCSAISFMSIAKTFPMFYNKEIVMNVVEKLSKIHPVVDEKPLTNDEKNEIADLEYFPKFDQNINAAMSDNIERMIVHDCTWFLNTIIRLWHYTCLIVVVTWSILPLVVMGYEYFEHGETSLKLPFLTTYFFDPFTKTTWPLVYLHQVWSTVVAGLNIFGGDTFLYTFCMYIHMHFQLLCHRYEFVVSDSVIDTKKRLDSLIKRHQDLIDLVDQVERMCAKSILINIVMSSVLICLSAFNITFSNNGEAIIAFVIFLVSQLLQISIICFFADLLMKSSIKISDAIYKSHWYNLDPSTKKSIFLILIRSQRPCRLTAANFADLNLSCFTTILSRSWSYFALLRTVYK